MATEVKTDERRFWERLGFEYINSNSYGNYYWQLKDPEGKVVKTIGIRVENYFPDELHPDLTGIEALGYLFKYAVSKLSETREINITIPPQLGERYIVRIGHDEAFEDKDLAQALKKAIMKVIEGE